MKKPGTSDSQESDSSRGAGLLCLSPESYVLQPPMDRGEKKPSVFSQGQGKREVTAGNLPGPGCLRDLKILQSWLMRHYILTSCLPFWDHTLSICKWTTPSSKTKISGKRATEGLLQELQTLGTECQLRKPSFVHSEAPYLGSQLRGRTEEPDSKAIL